MDNTQNENRSLKALFVDLDTVLMKTEKDLDEKMAGNPKAIREQYIKYRIRKWEKDEFLQLTDEEILVMDSWNRDWLELLGHLDSRAQIILYSRTPFDPNHMELMAGFRGVYRTKFLHCPDIEILEHTVHDMMADQKEPDRYMILSRENLGKLFPNHFFQIKPMGETDPSEIEITCKRILSADPKDYFSWTTRKDSRDDRDNEIFYKVIFLDIDGVLNDEGKEYEKGIIVDHQMVKCLKSIVDRTGAQIILSSSWKYAYREFVNDHYQTTDHHLTLLQEAFDLYGIHVSGITPLSNASGPDARPLEIQEWLRKFDKIYSYVILDDDTFWTWGFLQRNVVTTQTYVPDDDRHPYVRGLTMEHADKAVAILNDQGAMIRRI